MTLSTLSPITGTLLVAAGGALGAVLRYQLGRVVAQLAGPGAAFPWGTLAANVIGSLAMGLLFGWLARGGVESGSNEALRLLLGVGLLGGFTTFSAFSLEMMQLIERGATGLALAYAGVSVIAGLAALWLGLAVMRGAA